MRRLSSSFIVLNTDGDSVITVSNSEFCICHNLQPKKATNDETGEVNVAVDPLSLNDDVQYDTIPKIAQRYKARDQPWALVVDENYGEGSAREHAALQPRFYGKHMISVVVVLYNRINVGRVCLDHCKVLRANTRDESQGILTVCAVTMLTLFQKQGILPLWFSNKDDFHRIGQSDLIETIGLEKALNGSADNRIDLRISRKNGDTFLVQTYHTMSRDQLRWLRAGSALNYIKQQIAL